MSYIEIEQLRKSGNLEEAYQMAASDLKMAVEQKPLPLTTDDTTTDKDEDSEIGIIPETPLTLGKRAMAWVLYDFMKQNTNRENFTDFMVYLKEFVELQLDPEEKMVVNQLMWLIGKAAFEYTKEPDFDIQEMEKLADTTMKLQFSRQSKGYSFLFKALHKALKDSPKYIDFASWWDLRNFIHDDYRYTKQDDGKRIMAVAEQGCNRYAKHLLMALERNTDEETKDSLYDKIRVFLPIVQDSINHNKHYRKLPYYQVSLLLGTDEHRKGFKILKSRARENQDEFWVWQLMSLAFEDDFEKQIACLSTALLCHARSDKLIKIRLELAKLLIEQEYYDEAKTEIALILQCCLENKFDIPDEVTEWGEQKWYGTARVSENNYDMYEDYRVVADEIIFGDIPQQKVVVENVNHDKKILNFIGLDHEKGYCKYNSSLKKVKEGDVLLVRIQPTGFEGRYNLLSAKKLNEKYLEGILKHFAGEVVIPTNKAFGFVDGMFATPDVCSGYNLSDGEYVTGKAMISYNKKKEEWGWKVISIDR